MNDLIRLLNQLNLNILTSYRPLSGSSYVELTVELRSSKKGLINIKSKYQKRFLQCHVRHINPVKIYPERIRKVDKKLVRHITNPEKITHEDKELISDLDYDGIEFPVQENDFCKIKKMNNICINVFGYENGLTFPIYISDQKLKNSMDLLLVTDADKSHYVYIKNFNKFIFHKTKNKNKKYFYKSCLQCFSSENVLTKHKEDCLSINDTQSVRLEKGRIEFKNYFQQILVPLKIYPDFECNLRGVGIYESSYSEKYQKYIPCSFAYKVVCINNRFSKPIVVFSGKNAAYEFIKAILVMIEHFNKNLIMSEEEEQFQSCNKGWICEKLIDDDNEKIRDHCHETGKL